KGPLPAPGQWAQLSVAATDLGLKEGRAVSALTLQEYGGVAYWDAVALSGVVAAGPEKPQSAEAVARLRAFYLAYIARPVTDELAARQADWERARADREAAEDAIPGTMTFADRGTPRHAFVM